MLQKKIIEKLEKQFNPFYLNVINESQNHRVPPDAETHFKIIIVSEAFNAKSRVARHREIYQLLQAELNGGIHALALHLFTPVEWQEQGAAFPDSPDCAGAEK